MKVKNQNASSRKTRDAIKRAFAEVLQEKQELRFVTVKEIVQKAQITRSSFYNHYDNIYDVAKDFQEEILDVLVYNDKKVVTSDDLFSYIHAVTQFLKEHEDMYSRILSSSETFVFMERLNKLIKQKLLDLLKYQDDKEKGLKATFFTDGTINLVIRYFRHETSYTLEDIGEFIKKEIKDLFL